MYNLEMNINFSITMMHRREHCPRTDEQASIGVLTTDDNLGEMAITVALPPPKSSRYDPIGRTASLASLTSSRRPLCALVSEVMERYYLPW